MTASTNPFHPAFEVGENVALLGMYPRVSFATVERVLLKHYILDNGMKVAKATNSCRDLHMEKRNAPEVARRVNVYVRRKLLMDVNKVTLRMASADVRELDEAINEIREMVK